MYNIVSRYTCICYRIWLYYNCPPFSMFKLILTDFPHVKFWLSFNRHQQYIFITILIEWIVYCHQIASVCGWCRISVKNLSSTSLRYNCTTFTYGVLQLSTSTVCAKENSLTCIYWKTFFSWKESEWDIFKSEINYLIFPLRSKQKQLFIFKF